MRNLPKIFLRSFENVDPESIQPWHSIQFDFMDDTLAINNQHVLSNATVTDNCL